MENVEEVIENVKIPLKRIEELKGDADSTLRMLEKKLEVELDVDEEGHVEIGGTSTNVFFAITVIREIGRGFEPRIALKLKSDDYGFKLVDLRDYAKNSKSMTRLQTRKALLRDMSAPSACPFAIQTAPITPEESPSISGCPSLGSFAAPRIITASLPMRLRTAQAM